MSRLQRLCGTAPEGRVSWALRRRLRPERMVGIESERILMGPVTRWVRDQGARPSCGGQSCSAIIEALYPELPRISAVDIWRGARRRLGYSLDDLGQGTKWSAIWSELAHRGVDDWAAGEDESKLEGGKGAAPAGDNLRDEMRASDRRGLAQVYRLSGPDDVDAAIAAGHAVGISTGTRDAYVGLRQDEVADARHLGGDSDGHAQRIVGRVIEGGRRLYVIQNSWGSMWGGCHVAYRSLPGHCLAEESVVRAAWQLWGVTRARP